MTVQGIIDPTGSGSVVESASPVPAPKVERLAGLRVGVLENTKRNAAQMLEAIVDELQGADDFAEVVRHTKRQFAMPFSDDELRAFQDECDVVIIGVGDCGSCSAAAVADGIALESRGIPTAVICTDEFEGNSRAMAKLKGNATFPFIVTEHPVANLDSRGIRDRAVTLARDVTRRLVGERVANGVA